MKLYKIELTTVLEIFEYSGSFFIVSFNEKTSLNPLRKRQLNEKDAERIARIVRH